MLITPTQYTRFEKNKHLAQLSCRLYIRRDHKAEDGHEISTMITNPIFEQHGSGKVGVKSLGKYLSKLSKLAIATAPMVAAAGAPQAAAVGAVGNFVGKGRQLKANRYRLAKKKSNS